MRDADAGGATASADGVAFEIGDLLDRRSSSRQAAMEFLRVPSLSLEVYVLPAGGVDGQLPHAQDEVYYIVRGRALFRVEEEDRPVQPGTVLYVRAGVEHRFHTITEELVTLVFFAPAFTGPAR
jgi:quercetin dioxygenase-like cupin family protein